MADGSIACLIDCATCLWEIEPDLAGIIATDKNNILIRADVDFAEDAMDIVSLQCAVAG